MRIPLVQLQCHLARAAVARYGPIASIANLAVVPCADRRRRRDGAVERLPAPAE